MGLRIVSNRLEEGGPSKENDGYIARLRKYVPAEAVGFWLAVSNAIQSAAGNVPTAGLLWLFFVIGLVFTFLFTKKGTTEAGLKTAWKQIGLSCGAFIVWVLATGGALTDTISFYHPLYGNLLLITYTVAISFVIPEEEEREVKEPKV
ncbi:hypothetical protein Lepto7375DRAFT_0920 [Leptolyngbya sp. PCC 7375]|nr:hypothetical protein Lepto7375DRAFT_0920 [Leptolyngbya sp. PCC 7375]